MQSTYFLAPLIALLQGFLGMSIFSRSEHRNIHCKIVDFEGILENLEILVAGT
jgi:hypothetical protein